jgi:hypothetical protein
MLAIVFSSMIVVGFIGLAGVMIGGNRKLGPVPTESCGLTAAVESRVVRPPPWDTPAKKREAPGIDGARLEPPERPIEDILLENGEDPGAVYYMSRVREAVREGNPTFARELFRQMKEEHSRSVLIEEAETMVENARSRS